MNTGLDDFESFLYWVKDTTEKRWADFSESKKDGNWWNQRHNLFEGAKWTDPLSDEEIDALESKWNIKFSPSHRSFLKILHKVDKEEVIEYEDDETGEITLDSFPLFHDWRDDAAIKERFEWPFECMRFDMFESVQPSWLKSWGIKPDDKDECIKIIEAWRQKAPVLIPFNTHRYLVAAAEGEESHVLSSYGFDMLLYGINLKEHLLYELKWDLGLDVREYDDTDVLNPPPSIISSAIKNLTDSEEDSEEDNESVMQAAEERNKWLEERRKAYKPIPYWDEVILYYSSGWSTVGLQFPYEDTNASVQPIVKSADPDSQKIFNDFATIQNKE